MSRADKLRRRNQRKIKHQRRYTAIPMGFPPEILRRKDVVIVEYDITWEPLTEVDPENAPVGTFDDPERDEVHELLLDDPAAAVPRVQALLDRHPDSPMLMNWLFGAYHALDQNAEAQSVAERNYELHPRYLFARLDLADVCLERGELSRIEEIFGGKFELKSMYPHRKVFHSTEVVSFAYFMIRFLLRKGEKQQAGVYLKMLRQLDPDAEVTRRAAFLVEGPTMGDLARVFARLMGRK